MIEASTKDKLMRRQTNSVNSTYTNIKILRGVTSAEFTVTLLLHSRP